MSFPWKEVKKSYVVNQPKAQVAEKLGDLFLRGEGILDRAPLKGEYIDYPDRFFVNGGSRPVGFYSLFGGGYALNDRYPFWMLHGELIEMGSISTEVRLNVRLSLQGKIGLGITLSIGLWLVFGAIWGKATLPAFMGAFAIGLFSLFIFSQSRRQLLARFERNMSLGES